MHQTLVRGLRLGLGIRARSRDPNESLALGAITVYGLCSRRLLAFSRCCCYHLFMRRDSSPPRPARDMHDAND